MCLPPLLACLYVPCPPLQEDSLSASQKELCSLQESMADVKPVGPLLSSCLSLDQVSLSLSLSYHLLLISLSLWLQAKALLVFVEALSEQTLRSTVAMTAARGRGKSAALGLSIAAAVAFGYSNIFVTSPSPENLRTVFQFVFRGFDSLLFTEHQVRGPG